MSQTYAEFKTWLQTFLWKSNDTVVANNLDNLITMANAEMERDLDIHERTRTETVTVTTNDFVPFVAGLTEFDSIISIVDTDKSKGDGKPFRAVPLSTIYQLRTNYAGIYYPYYAPDNLTNDAASASTYYIRFPDNWSATATGSINLTFRKAIPDYATDNISWVEHQYLDYYTYTVLSHAAPFLREDDRVPLWIKMKTDALNSILEDDKHRKSLGGSPLKMLPHTTVPSGG